MKRFRDWLRVTEHPDIRLNDELIEVAVTLCVRVRVRVCVSEYERDGWVSGCRSATYRGKPA